MEHLTCPQLEEIRLDNRVRGSPVKILFLIDRLGALGGAESVLIEMTRMLPPAGFECAVATFDPAPTLANRFDCPVHVFPLTKTYYPHAAAVAGRLVSLIRSGGFQIVQTFFPTSDLWGGLIVRLATSAKLISSRRDMGHTIGSGHKVAYRLLASMYHQVHAVSGLVRQAAIDDLRWHPSKVFTVHNGIDLAQLAARAQAPLSRADLDCPADTPIIATVGNLRHIKGTDVLINAARRVCERRPDAVFLIAGHPNETVFALQLRQMAQDFGIERNIRFLGPRSDVPAILRLSAVFALPSRNEGFSNALVEAMALGLPCVATAVGGNREAIDDGRDGFLIPNEDHAALADRILALIGDPALAGRLGEAARLTVQQRFTLNSMLRRLTELYNALLV